MLLHATCSAAVVAERGTHGTHMCLCAFRLCSFFSGFLAFAVCLVGLEVVASGVVAFFVCWSEDPAQLNRTHPEAYAKMLAAVGGHHLNARPPAQQNRHQHHNQQA
jgi:hypothetical protein